MVSDERGSLELIPHRTPDVYLVLSLLGLSQVNTILSCDAAIFYTVVHYGQVLMLGKRMALSIGPFGRF